MRSCVSSIVLTSRRASRTKAIGSFSMMGAVIRKACAVWPSAVPQMPHMAAMAPSMSPVLRYDAA